MTGDDSSDSDFSGTGDGLSESDVVTGQTIRLAAREIYTKKSAQLIKDFDPSSDRLQIWAEDFGLGTDADFVISKNKKMFKSLQASDTDFISKVNKKDVFILFNHNGRELGLGDLGGVVAVIRNSSQFNVSQFALDLVEIV